MGLILLALPPALVIVGIVYFSASLWRLTHKNHVDPQETVTILDDEEIAPIVQAETVKKKTEDLSIIIQARRTTKRAREIAPLVQAVTVKKRVEKLSPIIQAGRTTKRAEVLNTSVRSGEVIQTIWNDMLTKTYNKSDVGHNIESQKKMINEILEELVQKDPLLTINQDDLGAVHVSNKGDYRCEQN